MNCTLTWSVRIPQDDKSAILLVQYRLFHFGQTNVYEFKKGVHGHYINDLLGNISRRNMTHVHSSLYVAMQENTVYFELIRITNVRPCSNMHCTNQFWKLHSLENTL